MTFRLRSWQMNMINNVKFDEHGLIPTIVQDDTTGKVLMLAYMNKESLEKTIESKETWFYSRSRKELWHKGATSGNKQTVTNIQLDCDGDALLINVHPKGPACHTGSTSCFHHGLDGDDDTLAKREVIHSIVDIIEDRRNNPEEGSYTTYLFNEGIDKVLKKVGEEASEVIIGAKNNDKDEIKWEVADLIYHTLVLLNMTHVNIGDIKEELFKRHVQKKADNDE